MDLLVLAEENFLLTFSLVLGIGLLQGAILGRGIRNRFPKLKNHARIISMVLFILFSINAIFNIIKFVEPSKLSIDNLTTPQTVDEGISFVYILLGFDTGFGSVIAVFVSITLVLLLRFAQLPGVARYFIFSLSVIMLLIGIVLRFTEYTPTQFHVIIYALYQFGITFGIFFVTRRKESSILNEFK